MIGKGIKLSTGFDLNSQSPLDNREVFETIEERDALPSINLYEGLTCYVKETKKNYQYIDGDWTIKNGGIERISYGDTEPSDGDTLLWIDTASDNDVSSLLPDALISEFRTVIADLNSQIADLKARVLYLEQNGGGGGTVIVDSQYIMLEDGNQLMLEDGDYLLLESYEEDNELIIEMKYLFILKGH